MNDEWLWIECNYCWYSQGVTWHHKTLKELQYLQHLLHMFQKESLSLDKYRRLSDLRMIESKHNLWLIDINWINTNKLYVNISFKHPWSSNILKLHMIFQLQVVPQGTIRLERPCAVAVEGPDRACYVLDREGSRVVRHVRGRAVQVAGSTEPGSGAQELNAGPTGRIYATWNKLIFGSKFIGQILGYSLDISWINDFWICTLKTLLIFLMVMGSFRVL